MKNYVLSKGCPTIRYILAVSLLLYWGTSPTFAASPISAVQQQNTVTGTVSDSAGPLPGVTVTIKGKPSYTTTDKNGGYSIDCSMGEILVFSYIGYKTQEVVVNNRDTFSVILLEDAATLEEVTINAGYYTVKERESTGSIARVTAKDIAKQPVANPLAALQGRMAGVDVVQTTGVPGGGFEVRIRGRNSLRAEGNNPLYIVDGMPYAAENRSDSNASAGVLGGSGISPLNGINPSDIESIEVLKDADATAIYGSRGANGVVLITTKKGKAGKTRFTLNAYSGTATVTKMLDLMDTSRYLPMRRQAFANDGITEIPEWAYDVNGAWSQERSTDWQKELIGGTAFTTNVDGGISGGNENTQFSLRGKLYRQSTVFPGDFSYRKAAAHLSVNHSSVDGRFTMTTTVSYVADRNNLPGLDLTRTALTLAPNAPALYDPQGNLNWENSTWENPLAALLQKYEAVGSNLNAAGTLGYRLAPGLTAKATLGYAENRLDEDKKTPHTIYNPAFGMTSARSSLLRSNSVQKSWNIEPQLNYEREFSFGKLSLLAGATFQERDGEAVALNATGFSNNSLIGNPTAATRVDILGYNTTEYRYAAIFGRINYALAGKYFLNLTGRRDGSSRFGAGNRFANFGAAGAAWLFGEEATVQELLPWLSFGKLRGSYGTTGSDQIGDYQFLNTYGPTGIAYGGTVGLQPLRLYNPDFSWESTSKWEAALELGFFNNRVMLTGAWYRNRSSSQLVGIPLPGTTGFASIQSNLDATVQNEGIEVELRTTNIRTEGFTWNTSVNITAARNKLLRFPGLESSTYASQFVVGQPLDIIKGYRYTGVDPDTGLYSFRDYNNDGAITEADRQNVIALAPKFYGGMQNSLQYKGWQLDFLFQFVKQKGYNYMSNGVIPGLAQNLPAAFDNNPGVQQYTAGYNNDAVDAFYRFSLSDGGLTDASYIRLKNLSCSYTLPQKWLPGVGCRLYLQGQNLLTITSFKGNDPENQTRGTLPPLKIYTLGAEFNF